MPRIFATKVWGLDAESWGALGFSKEGVRNSLSGQTKPDDFVLYLGTQGSETRVVEERGRLIGLVKVDAKPVATEDLVEPSAWAKHVEENGGTPKWQYGLPITEAWRFTNKPLPDERDVLPRFRDSGLGMKLATNYVELLPSETEAVLALPRERVPRIYSSVAIEAAHSRQVMRAGLRPVTAVSGKGPVPILGRREVTYSVKPAATYCMELVGSSDENLPLRLAGIDRQAREKRHVYKIGWATDVTGRQSTLNFAFPNPSRLGWEPILVQKRYSQLDAYRLEQAVLVKLASRILPNRAEIVVCAPEEVHSAFATALASLRACSDEENAEFVVHLVDQASGANE